MANPFDLGKIGDLMQQAKAMQERLASVQNELHSYQKLSASIDGAR